jgi:hypothetical protein
MFLLGTLAIFSLSTPALANQYVTAKKDGEITFNVATDGVTRVGVKGTRIRRIVNDDSAFEMSNDEETGDVFFRLKSNREPKSEVGFIITEAGITIGYTLLPKKRISGAVIITIDGLDKSNEAEVVSSASFTDDIAATMTQIVRDVAKAHVFGRHAKGKKDHVVKKVQVGDFTARVLVVVAGKSGRLLREQDFSKGARAVWVQNTSLAPKEATFVIVVGDK